MKNGGTSVPGGRVSRQKSEKEVGRCNLFSVFFLYLRSPFRQISGYFEAETYKTCLNNHFPSETNKQTNKQTIKQTKGKIAIF